MSETMYTEIRDMATSPQEANTLAVKVKNNCETGIGIALEHHTTKVSAEGYEDVVIHLEFDDGKPILRVWADINREEPTHIIDLSGAHAGRRLTTFKGHLYYQDEAGAKHLMAEFEESATTAAELERRLLDRLWDNRLDAASCSPHFEYEVVA